MSIPRMNYPQYRKARKLTHECCNYCDGNCLLLDDGEECVCPEHFLFAAVPVVSCRCSPAGWGAVCRDHPEPGQREAVRLMRCCIYTEIQPGQILPGLRGADAPEARGRKAAEKIPASCAVKPLNRPP